MRLTRVIPGEEELGEQRRCPSCREWWPDTAEFFVRWAHWGSRQCKACRKERLAQKHAATAARRSTVAHACRDCPVTVPATRERCHYCTRTRALAVVS